MPVVPAVLRGANEKRAVACLFSMLRPTPYFFGFQLRPKLTASIQAQQNFHATHPHNAQILLCKKPLLVFAMD